MERREHTTATQPQSKNSSGRSTRQRAFTLKKASPSIHPLARWLLDCTPEQKLAAVLLLVLLQNEDDFTDHLYSTSNAGNDLMQDWQVDIAEIMSDEARWSAVNIDDRARAVAGVLLEGILFVMD